LQQVEKRMTAELMTDSSQLLRSLLHELFPVNEHRLVWLAGGTARDTLLQRQIKDIDLVAALSAAKLELLGFRPVEGKTTGSIWFRNFKAFGKVEITRIATVEALQADLRRRDFTVNAMLVSLDGVLTDPLGGMADLEGAKLRPCSTATFTADPLRIFRAFRFAAEGFLLTEEAAALIRSRNWGEALQIIPVERFSREMLKALAAPDPPRFFDGMVEFSVGGNWLPEMFRMAQIPAGPPQNHPEGSLLTHSLQVLGRVSARSADTLARFCAFFHDIGKLATVPPLYPQHCGHEDAGFTTAEQFCRRLVLPTAYGRALAWTSRLHGSANRFHELRASTKISVAEQAIRGGIVDILPLISAADKVGNDITADWRRVVAVIRMTSEELGIDTARLLAMQPQNRAAFILQKRSAVLGEP
jgi:tRNA nucleotidyltransferase (CCA-adding enzyme)